MTLDREVPHYSLRKLGIGVVSVLLGTTMYFGTNNAVANADEVVNSSNANSDGVAKETNAANNVMSASAVTLNSASPSTNSVPQNTQSGAVSNRASVINSTAANNATSQEEATPTSTADSTATQNFAVPQSSVANNDGQILANNKVEQDNNASVTLNDGATLSTANNAISNPYPTSTLIFKDNGIKANDEYTFRFPKRYVQSLGAGALQNSGDMEQGDDNDYLYVTDKFSVDSTVNQSISLKPNDISRFLVLNKADSVYPGEIFNFNVSVKKNDGEWKNLPFTYQIPTSLDGKLLSIAPSRVLDGRDFHNEETLVASIPVHNQQRVQYELALDSYCLSGARGVTDSNGDVHEYNNTFNHGGTVTFTVPDYFTVDTTSQLTYSDGNKSDATISQEGNTVTVHIPAGSKALVDNALYFYGTVNAPDSFLAGGNTAIKFTNEKYVQKFNNNTSKQFTADDTTIIVAPKVPNKSDGFVYDVYQKPSYNYVGGSQDDDDLQGSVDNKSSYDTAKFYVANAINTARKNVQIHVDYPQGIDFSPINGAVELVGNSNNHFTVTYTFTDGSKETATSEKKSQSKKNVKSIDVTVDELDPGAAVVLGPTYYTIADTMKVGDSLKTVITSIDGDTNKITQDDILLAKPKLSLGLDSSLTISQIDQSPTSDGGCIQYITIFPDDNNKYTLES